MYFPFYARKTGVIETNLFLLPDSPLALVVPLA
jgi:hypothetical protein